MNNKSIIVIGAGAAGCFAAIEIKRLNPKAHVSLLEASQKPLTKVLISGGGRCNVTHHQFDPKLLIKNYPRGSKELLSCMQRFGPQEICDWFSKEDVTLVPEKDGRMFPNTNKSQTIANTLLNALQREGVVLKKGSSVQKLSKSDQGFELTLKDTTIHQAEKILIATGSHPSGHEHARSLGHTITELAPSLFTFKIADPFLADLPGQSVSHGAIKLSFDRTISKKSFQYEGPILITHWGLSGPAILKLSAFAAKELHQAKYLANILINWISQSTEACFDELTQMRQSHPNKKCVTTPIANLTKRLWGRFLQDESNLTWQEMSKQRLRQLAETLTRQELQVSGKGVFKEEFVTCGGVKRSEVDFRTMESKKTPGLYFAGEVLDIDGITGGFNFQNAWTGGWIAAQSMSQEKSERGKPHPPRKSET